jgi:ElaB/YqjD/DUF883 family membrane-anchored ribosome-binding protein
MNTASASSSAGSSGMRDHVRNAANEAADAAREGVREFGKAASGAVGDIQKDLDALRNDFKRLADQVGDILTHTSNTAWDRAKPHVNEAFAQAQGSSSDAADAVREASEQFTKVVDESLKTRPYATLAVVAGLGFLFGMTFWRR